MEAIFANLNLDATAFLWHSANFVVLVAALWWLFFRPFTRLVGLRQERIQASLARAEEIDRLDRVAETKRQELLTEAHKEVSEIRRLGADQVRRFMVRSRTEANAEADRIRTQAAARHAAASTPRVLRNSLDRRKAVTHARAWAASEVRPEKHMSQNEEQYVETADVRQLRQVHWPIIRLFASHFVDQLELQLRKRQLLATGRWTVIRSVPQRELSGGASTHVFDLYGRAASSASRSHPRRFGARSGLVPWTSLRSRW